MAGRSIPFTDGSAYMGHPAYYRGMPPAGNYMSNAPSVRSAALPPVVAPRPGAWGWTKTATPPAINPSFWGVRGQNGNTLGS